MDIEPTFGSLTKACSTASSASREIHRAIAVIDVVGHIAAGRPGEQHRRNVHARVVNNLREAIDRFLETGVEAVDEDKNPPARRAPDARIEVCLRLSQVQAIGAQDDKVTLGIAWQRGGKGDVSWLARACWRNRDDDIGEIESSSSRPAEHDAWRLKDGRTRCRHKEVDLAGVRRARSYDEGAVRAAGAAGDDRRQSDRTEHADTGPARRHSSDPRAHATPQSRAQPHRTNAVFSRAT
jgi:hypothetical protein